MDMAMQRETTTEMTVEMGKGRQMEDRPCCIVDVGSEQYPSWICKECAENNGGKPREGVSTHNFLKCGWCEENKSVTAPRNWGYPKFEAKKINKPE